MTIGRVPHLRLHYRERRWCITHSNDVGVFHSGWHDFPRHALAVIAKEITKVESMNRKQHILDTVSDLLSELLDYDRKDDEELPRGAIEDAIETGEISVEEIASHFRVELMKVLA